MEFVTGFAAALAFGSLWFWVAFLILTVCLVWWQDDAPVLAGLGMVFFVMLCHVSGLIDLGSWTFMTFITSIVLYVAAGVGWSFIKWFSLIVARREKLQELRSAFVQEGAIRLLLKGKPVSDKISDPMPEELRKEFRRYLALNGYWNWRDPSDNVSEEHRTLIPTAAGYKSRIVQWMVFWPWSALWTLLNDPLRRLFNYIFTYLRATYQRIAIKVYGNVNDEM